MTGAFPGPDLPGTPAFPHDRRSSARIPATDLGWIREVRLKYGPLVSLVDLSSGGALLQTNTQLRPGTVQVLEIVGNGVETVPFRVLRCQIAQITSNGVTYQGACEFRRQLNLDGSRGQAQSRPARVDLALRQLVLRHREHVARGSGGIADGGAARALPRLLRSIQATAYVNDPLARSMCDVLAEVVPALDRGEPAAVLRGRVEQQLRRMLPNIHVGLGSTPVSAESGMESIYFAAGGESHASTVINVQLSNNATIPEWQFRLLQACSYLLEVLACAGTGLRSDRSARIEKMAAETEALRAGTATLKPAADAPAETTHSWQKIVARYRDGRLIKGYTHDFHPSRSQFSLWSSINAAPSERVVIPTTQLKAVFFVRDFDGDPSFIDRLVFDEGHAGGRRLEVMFDDGEMLIGSTLNYRPDGIGFFLNPADRRGNNQRIFVVASALRHVRFL